MTQAIYAAVIVAALARIGASFFPAVGALLLELTVLAWCTAFFGFALSFGPLLVGKKRAATAR